LDSHSRIPSEALTAALDAVAAKDRDAVHVVVPLEPSPEMLLAGASAGGISLKQVARIYRAMTRSF
jgi:hypothetical protein